MQQYFVKGALQLHQRVLMNEEQSHHIQHVLRMKEHTIIRIANDAQEVFLAHVEFDSRQVFAVLDEQLDIIKREHTIVLAQALIKGEKWDYLLQKACELGVGEIQPIQTKRCVVKMKDEKLDKKQIRWNKIAEEACEQCKRPDIVQVHKPIDFTELFTMQADLKLIAYEAADCETMRLKDVLMSHPDSKRILCVIGPEGGFEAEEVAACLDHGFLCVSLGSRILRAETAAVSMINSITFTYDC